MNEQINKKVIFRNLGTIDYKKAWDYQEELFARTIAIKVENRNLPGEDQRETPNYLLFCEHPHVYTLGKSGSANNLFHRYSSLYAFAGRSHYSHA